MGGDDERRDGDGNVQIDRVNVVAKDPRCGTARELLANGVKQRVIHARDGFRGADVAALVEVLALQQAQKFRVTPPVLPGEKDQFAHRPDRVEVANAGLFLAGAD